MSIIRQKRKRNEEVKQVETLHVEQPTLLSTVASSERSVYPASQGWKYVSLNDNGDKVPILYDTTYSTITENEMGQMTGNYTTVAWSDSDTLLTIQGYGTPNSTIISSAGGSVTISYAGIYLFYTGIMIHGWGATFVWNQIRLRLHQLHSDGTYEDHDYYDARDAYGYSYNELNLSFTKVLEVRAGDSFSMYFLGTYQNGPPEGVPYAPHASIFNFTQIA